MPHFENCKRDYIWLCRKTGHVSTPQPKSYCGVKYLFTGYTNVLMFILLRSNFTFKESHLGQTLKMRMLQLVYTEGGL